MKDRILGSTSVVTVSYLLSRSNVASFTPLTCRVISSSVSGKKIQITKLFENDPILKKIFEKEEESKQDPDILSSIDSAKLMDPKEVLNSVFGEASISESVQDIKDGVIISTENSVMSNSIGESQQENLSTTVSSSDALKPTKSNDGIVDAPTVSDILRFAIPAIGVWLCSPLLSLIDTSAVGLLSGTAQQAALNPAVAVTDYSTLLIAFMYTATTNLVAAAKEKDSQTEEHSLTIKTFITSLQLSGLVGATLGATVMLFAGTLLRAIIGNDSIDPEIFKAAIRYVRIRALGMPAAVIIGSAQSACLGMKDVRSPLYVLMAAAIVNFIGDCLFVGSSSSIFGGAAGAAWATVFSQYAALGFFVNWLTLKSRKPRGTVNLTNAILELTSTSDSGKSRRKRFRRALQKSNIFGRSKAKASVMSEQKKTQRNASTRGFLAGKFSLSTLTKLPSRENIKDFLPFVIPVTTTAIGRVSSYVAMSNVVSSSLGTIGMAAQQIIVSLFYCLTPVADSLNLTAQSFIPAIFEKTKSRARATYLKKSFYNFMKTAAIFGLFMSGAASCIPVFSGFFTSDPVVISQVNSVVPYLAGCFILHGFITAGEGNLLGQKDLGFLGKSYASFFFAVPYFMLRIKRANASLLKVWQVFLGYQIIRMGLFMLRLLQLQRRTDKEAAVR